MDDAQQSSDGASGNEPVFPLDRLPDVVVYEHLLPLFDAEDRVSLRLVSRAMRSLYARNRRATCRTDNTLYIYYEHKSLTLSLGSRSRRVCACVSCCEGGGCVGDWPARRVLRKLCRLHRYTITHVLIGMYSQKSILVDHVWPMVMSGVARLPHLRTLQFGAITPPPEYNGVALPQRLDVYCEVIERDTRFRELALPFVARLCPHVRTVHITDIYSASRMVACGIRFPRIRAQCDVSQSRVTNMDVHCRFVAQHCDRLDIELINGTRGFSYTGDTSSVIRALKDIDNLGEVTVRDVIVGTEASLAYHTYWIARLRCERVVLTQQLISCRRVDHQRELFTRLINATGAIEKQSSPQ